MRGRRPIARALAAALRRRARGGRAAGGERVTLLVLHAWGTGGTVRGTLDVAARLAHRHDVEVLSLVRRADEPFFPPPAGVTVTAVDDQRPAAAPLIGRLLGRLPSVLVPHEDAPAARACTLWTDVCLVRRIRRTRPGLIVGSRPGLTALALAIAPAGARVAGHEPAPPSAHPPEQQRLIAARYPELDALVVGTRAAEHELTEVLGAAAAPIVRIPPAARELGGAAPSLDGRVILAAGRLAPDRGHQALIEAFALVNARHPEWQLRVCGGGSERRRLKRQAGALGLGARVSLPGPVLDLGEEMARAAMFVVPGRAGRIPLGLVEAMHKGLPAIGPSEPIEDRRNGLVARGVAELAAAMLELIEDEALRRRCGAEAARTAAAHRMEVVGPQWDGFVAALRAPRPAAGRVPAQATTSSSSVGSS